MLSTSSVCCFLQVMNLMRSGAGWLQHILVHTRIYENAYLFSPVILRLFHTAMDICFFNSLYSFLMTKSLLIQMSSSSNAATVCNMFLVRLFVRIFCYYCPCSSLTPCLCLFVSLALLSSYLASIALAFWLISERTSKSPVVISKVRPLHWRSANVSVA